LVAVHREVAAQEPAGDKKKAVKKKGLRLGIDQFQVGYLRGGCRQGSFAGVECWNAWGVWVYGVGVAECQGVGVRGAVGLLIISLRLCVMKMCVR
jgi:hypothetical protein